MIDLILLLLGEFGSDELVSLFFEFLETLLLSEHGFLQEVELLVRGR